MIELIQQYAWLWLCVIVYESYCVWTGLKNSRADTAKNFFVAGGNLPGLIFALAATATIYSGWTFVGIAGQVYYNGFQCFVALAATVALPFTGILFLKRQWMLGKRYGFITPGEMFSAYFQSDGIRWLVVLVAFTFSLFYLGVQLYATGFLFNILTDGKLGIGAGMILLSLVVVIYAGWGGLRAVAYVDIMQVVLLVSGLLIMSLVAFHYIGGWEKLKAGLSALALFDYNRTPEGYSHYLAVSAPFIQSDKLLSTADITSTNAVNVTGAGWTGMLNLTYIFSLMGIQAAPAFTMWAFANQSPKGFVLQQVWLSAGVMGFILIVLVTLQGLTGHLLGADVAFLQNHPDQVNNLMGGVLKGQDLMAVSPGKQDRLVPILMSLIPTHISGLNNWLGEILVGFLAVCALAAIQSTAAPYISTFSGIVTRDILLKRWPHLSDKQQIHWGRGIAVVISIGALALFFLGDFIKWLGGLGTLGGLAVAYGSQMWPALAALCWFPCLTRRGIFWGLLIGLLVVTVTDILPPTRFGLEWWGRWPLTVHSAGWGILFNVLVVLLFSLKQDQTEMAHRLTFHQFLKAHDSLPKAKQKWVWPAWVVVLTWFIFAVGPGSVVGNTLFGNPNDPGTWIFGIPSLWAWQISVGWGGGVLMMWFLARYMEMSTEPRKRVIPLQTDEDNV